MYNIDIGLINTAYLYYLLRGYQPLTAPMLVDKDIVELTLPTDRKAHKHLDKYYVGSAEQSFYQLIKGGFKPDGSYMMLTPCQRSEINDELHLDIFLKVELVSTNKHYTVIAKDVHDFYTALGQSAEVIVPKNDPSNIDLEINDIEVGSFGFREYNGYIINYGTGLALPRYSQAIKMK